LVFRSPAPYTTAPKATPNDKPETTALKAVDDDFEEMAGDAFDVLLHLQRFL
jgi:hypothetical protein